MGEPIEGVLDYMFDFEFFRFNAEEGLKYRMNVNHELLQATSVTSVCTRWTNSGVVEMEVP